MKQPGNDRLTSLRLIIASIQQSAEQERWSLVVEKLYQTQEQLKEWQRECEKVAIDSRKDPD